MTEQTKQLGHLTIAPDLMTATLKLDFSETETGAPLWTTEEVIRFLQEGGVTEGIDKETIKKAVLSQQETPFTAAKGTPSIYGKDGYVTFAVPYQGGIIPPKTDWAGLADYREIQMIPEVEEGALIAKRHRAVQGTPGVAVTGKTLTVPPAKEAAVKCGPGVVERDGRYFAAIKGRLSVDQNSSSYLIDVSRSIVHQGDVALASGNLRFQGDIEVTGNVETGMRIEAEGDLLIRKNMQEAVAIAGKSAAVNGHVFSSVISCGAKNEAVKALCEKTADFFTELQQFASNLSAVLQKTAGHQPVDTQRVAALLMERSHASLPLRLKQFAYQVSKSGQSVPKEWTDFANKLYRVFLMKSSAAIHQEQLDEIIEQGAFLLSVFEKKTADQLPFVTIPYAINSEINAEGPIYVTGQGLFNCTLKSGDAVYVDGCVKGGSVEALNGIFVKEAGSESGVKTVFETGEFGTVELKKAHPEVTVFIGKRVHTFFKESGPVRLFVDEDGVIQQSSLTEMKKQA